MLEQAAALWFYALALMTALFVMVVVVQGVVRQVPGAVHALRRSAQPTAGAQMAPGARAA